MYNKFTGWTTYIYLFPETYLCQHKYHHRAYENPTRSDIAENWQQSNPSLQGKENLRGTHILITYTLLLRQSIASCHTHPPIPEKAKFPTA